MTKSAAIVLSVTCFACATRSLAVAPDCGDGQADAEAALALGDTPQFTEEPRLLNLRQLVQALAREYPPSLMGRWAPERPCWSASSSPRRGVWAAQL